jgi:hypothetical protein
VRFANLIVNCEILIGIDVSRDIRHLPNQFRPQNRDLTLHGLYISTRINIRRGICMFIVLMLSVVLGGKLVWDSWEIVFGAGSFFVAIPMLAMAVITFSES